VKKKPQHKVEEEKSLETVKSLENHGRLSSCNMNSQRYAIQVGHYIIDTCRDLSVTELNRIRAKMGTYYDEVRNSRRLTVCHLAQVHTIPCTNIAFFRLSYIVSLLTKDKSIKRNRSCTV